MEVHSKDISWKYLFIHQGEPGAVGLPGQPGVPGEDGATGKKVILLFSYYQSVKTMAPTKHLRPPGPRLTLPRADFICENEPSSFFFTPERTRFHGYLGAAHALRFGWCFGLDTSCFL